MNIHQWHAVKWAVATGCCVGISTKMEVSNSGFCNWFDHISEGKEFPADNKTQTVSVLRTSNHKETYLQ